ncbi:MAG: SGNH/GDSL hydrolase family protein [Candidatus Hydrogenedentes bacterium]|nr:SGNH/GDSL hydrolase family protein [Candidatus Hydrogenedentota bacterium]
MPETRRFARPRIALLAIALTLACLAVPCAAQEAPRPRTIAVFGSSVASGSVDHEGKGGYAGRLGALLAPRGWKVVNVSRGGDNTIKIAPRFETDLLPQRAGYVIIGLSLANEGIAKQRERAHRDAVYDQWRQGMQDLIARCRNAGMIVVVGNCYANARFTDDAELYVYTRRMNAEISRWDVPSINFLGAIDDGTGAWADGFYADGGHPSAAGHEEMFRAIVPSLFEALEARKPMPAKASGARFARVAGGPGPGPALSFRPDDPVHSFAMSLWIRPGTSGALAAVAGRMGAIRQERAQRGDAGYDVGFIEPGGETAIRTLEYRDGWIAYAHGDKAIACEISNRQAWHHVVVSHGCARGETELYLDGERFGSMPERILPEQFFLGGGAVPSGAAAAPQPAAGCDVKEWAVYRSALDGHAVKFIYEGGVFQSSLEVYAPLMDAEFSPGEPVENRAQSMAEVEVIGPGLTPRED